MRNTKLRRELDKVFGKGNYTIMNDAQTLPMENSRKMEELIKEGKATSEMCYMVF